ncbi:Oxidoreductase domain protein [Rhodospirillaceae bacterium LM-1]|nr:Oxidoreductase domain protein [Rhodospirillaceae bacterium LM-1]
MVRFGVVGYGYWGPNMVRNCAEAAGSQIAWVCDLNPDHLKVASTRYPAIRTTTNYRELLDAKDVDAVIIATPVHSHFDLAMAALRAGKHVLVEKPITRTSDQALLLLEEAKKRNLVLMVDHTFCYTEAVRHIRGMVQSGELGDVFYYDSIRVNLGLFQHDVDVTWDLAVHDLSILDFVLDRRPVQVSASGSIHVAGSPANIAYLTLFFDDATIAHVNVNWLAPVKIRRTLIGGSKRMIIYDELEPDAKVKIYDKGVAFTDNKDQIFQLLVGYRTGDMVAPQIRNTEALRTEIEHFVACVSSGDTPLTDGRMGLNVVRILEAATRSMAGRGHPVDI